MRRHIAAVFIIMPLLLSACGSMKNYLDPSGPSYAGGSVPAPRSIPDSIRVVSYNVKFSKRIPAAIEELRDAPGIRGADIVLLQEMDEPGVRAIADSLGLEYLYYPASVHRSHGKDFGNAILSRWPITEPRKILLPYERPMSDQRRIAVAATVDAGGLLIRVVSIHTETFWMSREKRIDQADSLLEALSREHTHVIVGGDFNTPFHSSIEDLEGIFTRRGFVRASAGVEWTAKMPPFGLFKMELDHIFTKGFDISGNGTWEKAEASDHIPLWVLARPGSTRIDTVRAAAGS
jgi:endonuclease/exonuclease/phosphatase family metal-dependent hydrolase